MCSLAPQWRTLLVKELRRKAIHLSGLSVPLAILLLGRTYTVVLITMALAVSLVLEAGRLNGKIRLPEVRDQEEEKVAGYIYYITGSLLAVILFPPMVAVAAMLMLSLGDAASGLIGSVLEKSNVRGYNQRWRIKPFTIVLGMFLVCLAIGRLSSGLTHLSFPVYLAGAVGATVADSVALFINNRCLDDNLTIPLFAGAMMAAALQIL